MKNWPDFTALLLITVGGLLVGSMLPGIGAPTILRSQSQSPPAPLVKTEETVPVLPNDQKLELQVLFQQVRIAELEMQQARDAFTKLFLQRQRDGYDLQLGSWVYVKKPDPKKEP